MGLFDLFKSKKSDYDVTNMKITDLKKGFVFEYDLKTWVVDEAYKYDWGDEFFSHEFKIKSDTETMFLSVEEDDALEVSVSEKIQIRKLHEDLPELLADENPPKSIDFEGNTYYLDEEAPGFFCNVTNGANNWVEFIAWDYIDEKEEKIITLEQWGEKEFDASIGKIIRPAEVSNIIPASNV
ncbi:MAG: DUF4178 domain-containing protein [Salinivirgaceae bacterium]|jgi:hypothetical protein|nr:DUF4178 domain-containing protein [Salinivirgaceae bacterium]